MKLACSSSRLQTKHFMLRVKTLNKAIEIARDLQLFCAEQGLSEALVHTDALDDALMNEWYLKKSAAKQKKNDFFKLI